MGEKIVVGPNFGGLVNAVKPFVIDNDSFPFLLNAYEWRGRIKRKRGTSLLTRLQRYFNSQIVSYNPTGLSITLDSSGAGNLIIGYGLDSSSNIVPGTVTITDTNSGDVYTDAGEDGILIGTPVGVGSINYASGAFGIIGGAGHTITAIFTYNPGLPVMGLRSLNLTATQFVGTIGFDTTYAYNILTTYPNSNYDISFYKNPPAMLAYPGYIPKTNVTPLTWNGQNYQQFWTVNYQNAFWATNGIPVPFNPETIGMQFKPIVAVTVTAGGPPAIVNLEITGHGLVVGDFLFINEVLTTTGINFETGYVIAVIDANNVTVEFPNAVIATDGTGGIAQYLTNTAVPGKDVIRFYDGDPTNGDPADPLLNGNFGWVNFMPPLSFGDYTIADLPPSQYYLVGARMISPFKDRLLFFGPVVQNSGGAIYYLQDTVVFSQVGTAFYTASFDGSVPISAKTTFFPILTPGVEVATPNAYWEDITGLGGYLTAGYEQPITTVSPNEDVLIVGFNTRQSRLVYSGDDILPFSFYIINSELGSGATFSIINLDKSVLSIGEHGFTSTSQIGGERFDINIPDALFEFSFLNNGMQRITAQRDFINEWIYFTYCSNENDFIFPTQTLQYNYREKTWAVFNECYTTYGQFRHSTGLTWAEVGGTFPTWNAWDESWASGASTVLQPKVIAGTPQGFVMQRDEGTGEGNSIYISNISFSTVITGITQAVNAVVTTLNTFLPGQSVTIMGVLGMTQINGTSYTIISSTPTTITLNVNSTGFTPYISGGTVVPDYQVYSPNHSLNNGDYIVIDGALGTVPVNGKVFKVFNSTEDGFSLDPPLISGTYMGSGLIQRMYIPLIQSKQFNPSWGLSRKTRINFQQYLLSTTPNAQITLLIYLSQNTVGIGALPYNLGPIVPDPDAENNTLVYSTLLYTCPESSNLGLTPPNTNLQMVTAIAQEQIWHRINTSLLGDTVQVGFTLSPFQMRDPTLTNQFAEIELHCMVIDVSSSSLLA
jgi:hypothetical protein